MAATPLGTILRERKHLLAGLLIALVVLAGLFSGLGSRAAWRLWNVPAADEPFMDVRVITAGAIAYRQGLDPMQTNNGDESGRRLNYPRIWQSLYLTGFGPEDARWFGQMSVLLFLLGILLMKPPPGWRGCGWMLGAVLSPAVLLGLERGNTDLLMFFLLAAALALPSRHVLGSLLLVLVAFVLKLFPLIGLAMLPGRGPRVAKAGLIAGFGFAILYLLFSLGDLELIQSGTPQSYWASYGLNVLPLWAAERIAGAGSVVRWLCWVVAGGLLALAYAKRSNVKAGEEGPGLDGLRVGAACYAGTFLLGTSFDYRLMFLLFALPELVRSAGENTAGRAGAARIALAGIYVSFWSMTIDGLAAKIPGGAWLGELITGAGQWAAFGALVWLLFRTLPDWLQWPRRDARSPEAGVILR